MKICKRCLEEKALDFFSPRKDGYLKRDAKCKKCNAELAKIRRSKNPGLAAEFAKKYREKNPEKARESVRRYRNKPETKEKTKQYVKKRRLEFLEAVKKCYRTNPEYRKKRNEYVKEWRKQNPESKKKYRDDFEKKFPEKHKAHIKVRDAVRKGKIVKPNTCENCMKEFKRIEGHHEDYSKPLEVKWLCVTCHRNLHLR